MPQPQFSEIPGDFADPAVGVYEVPPIAATGPR
jgi:hypothetical protein